MTGWSVRPYMPGDEEQLTALFSEVFGRPRSVDAWRWKLKGRQAPFETVWVAEREDGRIVGQYGGIPLRVKLRGQVHPAVHAVEAMTAREHRRQGMLTRLGSAAHDCWRQKGQVAVLGLPNEQWGTRNTALGYRCLFPLAWLRYPLRLERVVSRAGRVPTPLSGPARLLGAGASYLWRRRSHNQARRDGEHAGVRVERVTAPSTRFDTLWSEVSQSYDNVVVRDADWVEWRYLRAVGLDYGLLLATIDDKPKGHIAYRLTGSANELNGYIADLFVTPSSIAVANALMSAALADMSAAGAGVVLCALAPGSALYRHMRSFGFLMGSGQTSFSFEVVPLQPDFALDGLSNPAAWHLTAGDFDIDLA